MNDYTVERIDDYHKLTKFEVALFNYGAILLAKEYGESDPLSFPLEHFIDKGVVFMCYREGFPVGFLIATHYPYLFNPSKTVLRQEVFWAMPGTRASFFLFNEFLDFGKRNANYVISMIANRTRMTHRTMERYGFEKLETMYRMEVK